MKFLILGFLSLFCLGSALAEDAPISPDSELGRTLFDPPYVCPQEVPTSSPLRKTLFEQLRPRMEEMAKQPVRFEGNLRAFKNWALFVGRTVDAKGRSVSYPPQGNDDTTALWLRTKDGWRLVDYSGGHSDAFWLVWTQQYGVPKSLVEQ